MQKMEAKDLNGFRSEFELTCAAQDGNGAAWLVLWNRYKNMMMSRLIAVKGLTREELESEAIEVFSHKLENFCREKVSSENAFSMFSWLFCAVVNQTNKLIRQRKKEVHLYMEDVSANHDRDGSVLTPYPIWKFDDDEDTNPLQNSLVGINEEIYNTYNPERLAVRDIHDDDSDRVKAFYARLTQFEKDILEARREGLTMAEVAKRFACSVNSVKYRIQKAKRYANEIFQVCYA